MTSAGAGAACSRPASRWARPWRRWAPGPPPATAATRPLAIDTFASILHRHTGRPLVVHLWGLSCGPCMKELPAWSALHHERKDLDLVLIHVDPAAPATVERHLRGIGLAPQESWSIDDELDPFLRASIDPTWIGDMPRTLLIDRAGAVVRLRGVADLAEVRRWLDAQRQAR